MHKIPSETAAVETYPRTALRDLVRLVYGTMLDADHAARRRRSDRARSRQLRRGKRAPK